MSIPFRESVHRIKRLKTGGSPGGIVSGGRVLRR